MALQSIKSLDNIKLSKGDRARQKYLLGSVYEKKLWRGEDAQKSLPRVHRSRCKLCLGKVG